MATVILTGFMGTGKTAVGKRLAERLAVTFVDTDELVERAEGCSIDRLFAERGEAYFRAAERRAVIEAAAIDSGVIATGGGTIVDEDNRRRLHAAGKIVCLTADPTVILRRTERGTPRPLLAGPDPLARIRTLLAARTDAYATADLLLDTSTLSVDAVVERIVNFLEPQHGPERSERDTRSQRTH